MFDVYAPRDGYYTVSSGATAAVALSLHGETVTAAPARPLRLYLLAGNNRLAMTSGHAAVRSLDVSGDGSASGVLSREGASAALAGDARLVDSPHASAGSYIGRLGNSPSSTAEFQVEAPRSGRYLLVVPLRAARLIPAGPGPAPNRSPGARRPPPPRRCTAPRSAHPCL